jgi:hypothetical protein
MQIQQFKRNRNALLRKFDEIAPSELADPDEVAQQLLCLRQSLPDHLAEEECYLLAQFGRLGVTDAAIHQEARGAWLALGEVIAGIVQFLDRWIDKLPVEDTLCALIEGLEQQKTALGQAMETEEATLYALYARSQSSAANVPALTDKQLKSQP